MLSEDAIRNFAEDGYFVVRGAVAEEWLAAADPEIEEIISQDPPPEGTLGQHFYFVPPTQLPAADRALRLSGAMAAAEQLVQPLGLDHAFDHIQIALNIPPYSHRPGGPHLDGHRPNQDRPHSFTMLAAIYLSDEAAPDSGNLWVWPQSHLVHQRVFAERGPQALMAGSGHTFSIAAPPALAEPHPVLARRGDLLLAHYLLGHNIGGNKSPHTRRILYYRLSAHGHETRWPETLLDAYREYEGARPGSRE